MEPKPVKAISFEVGTGHRRSQVAHMRSGMTNVPLPGQMSFGDADVAERRLLPATDPLARQIHIGAGCAIETLAIGMSAQGLATEIKLSPRGAHGLEEVGRKPVARIALLSNVNTRRDNLAASISRRQTNRRPYAGPRVTNQEAEQIQGLASSDNIEVLVLHQPDRMRPLLEVFCRAFEIEVKTRHVYDERGSGSASTSISEGPDVTV